MENSSGFDANWDVDACICNLAVLMFATENLAGTAAPQIRTSLQVVGNEDQADPEAAQNVKNPKP